MIKNLYFFVILFFPPLLSQNFSSFNRYFESFLALNHVESYQSSRNLKHVSFRDLLLLLSEDLEERKVDLKLLNAIFQSPHLNGTSLKNFLKLYEHAFTSFVDDFLKECLLCAEKRDLIISLGSPDKTLILPLDFKRHGLSSKFRRYFDLRLAIERRQLIFQKEDREFFSLIWESPMSGADRAFFLQEARRQFPLNESLRSLSL